MPYGQNPKWRRPEDESNGRCRNRNRNLAGNRFPNRKRNENRRLVLGERPFPRKDEFMNRHLHLHGHRFRNHDHFGKRLPLLYGRKFRSVKKSRNRRLVWTTVSKCREKWKPALDYHADWFPNRAPFGDQHVACSARTFPISSYFENPPAVFSERWFPELI